MSKFYDGRRQWMISPMDDRPIPWPAELRALIDGGYRCRRCRASAVADDARQVVRVNPRLGDGPENVVVLCNICAVMHKAGK